MTEEKESRRRFFSRGLLLTGLLGAAGFVYSAYRFISPRRLANQPPLFAVRTREPAPAVAVNLNATKIELRAPTIPPGQALMVAIGSTPVIVVHEDAGFRAFLAACTHLGCLVKWDPAEKKFVCPCHAGTYDAEGQVISGPPPAALRPCRVEQKDETLIVSIG